jgi:hypothetical protein
MNATRMHVFTHVRESMKGRSGMPVPFRPAIHSSN